MARMTIGQFAHAAGVGVETVRYYQRRGLLPVPGRGGSRYREYDEAAAQRLRFIRRAQAAGFTLEEICGLLALDRTADRARIRSLATAKLDDIQVRLRELNAVARSLRALLHDCEHGRAGTPCPIVASFDTGPPRMPTSRERKARR